ncbi:MAG: PIN domain-containing protein, partial [Acidobacteria bacterium]|nr:PIN domain-containing protein [Acidobacteriota bacterium]
MRPRVYADTSVLGGCEDEDFRKPSLRLLETSVRGELTLVLSELTLRELEIAPKEVRGQVARVPEAHIEALSVCSEAEELAAAYIADDAVGERMLADALHIALASVARVDVLV